MTLHDDFAWQAKLMPHVKQILGQVLIQEAPADEDMRHNTDLLVHGAVRVAVRLRRSRYLTGFDGPTSYADQFTIRADRPSGADTELMKMMSGWGDYLFYGFEAPGGGRLACWIVGNLNEFRRWFWITHAGNAQQNSLQNLDGSSGFYTFNIADMPAAFVVSRKPYIQTEAA
jgi:hypothetical protein